MHLADKIHFDGCKSLVHMVAVLFVVWKMRMIDHKINALEKKFKIK